MLNKNQKLFGEAILQSGEDKQLHALLKNYSTEEAAARLSIYKNNFYRSLTDILLDIYPSIQQLVGNDYFEQLAKTFIHQHPPRSATVSLYGEHLPNFLRAHQLSEQLPYLPDCAALDWALHAAYYQKDVAAMAAEEFLQIDTQQLMQCKFSFHPATLLLQSSFSIFSIHDFLSSEVQDKEIRYDAAESVLVCRQEQIIQHYLLEAGTSVFINKLIQQKNLEQAITETMEEHSEFDPMQAVGFLIQTKTVTHLWGAE